MFDFLDLLNLLSNELRTSVHIMQYKISKERKLEKILLSILFRILPELRDFRNKCLSVMSIETLKVKLNKMTK